MNLLTCDQKIPTIAADHLNKTAPRSFCDVISEYGDMLNTQSVGQKLQHYFSGVQVNISPAASAANDGKAICDFDPARAHLRRGSDIHQCARAICKATH